MSEFKGYNLALIPEKSVAGKLEAYSQKLAKHNPSPYVLGVNSLAHVSVVQFNPQENIQLDLLWTKIKNLNLQLPKLTLNQIYHNEGSSYIWHGISIEKSFELKQLHNQLLEIELITDIKNSSGKDYFPHFTLGCVEKEIFKPEKYDINDDVTTLDNIPCKLCLGRSGPQYQFEEILYE